MGSGIGKFALAALHKGFPGLKRHKSADIAIHFSRHFFTRCGAFARSKSIDELPNLWNVLKGEMSIVGPRPEIPEIVLQYPERYHRRHDVLPGIAGLAQLNGRSDLTYDEIATYDLEYVAQHSMLTDLQILWRTAGIVLRGSGAR